MRKCKQCGNGMTRVHRTLVERFSYLAIYECAVCETEEFFPRRHTYHFGPNARCPHCGTFRLSKLRGRDSIDRMVFGPLNVMEWLAGGKLFHCCFCRIQFYDRRPLLEKLVSERVTANVDVPDSLATHLGSD